MPHNTCSLFQWGKFDTVFVIIVKNCNNLVNLFNMFNLDCITDVLSRDHLRPKFHPWLGNLEISILLAMEVQQIDIFLTI